MRIRRNILIVFSIALILCPSVLTSRDETFRVLSIDGGGVRGIIAAVVLEQIEKELGRPIIKTFDMIAGSSTGGIIALALTTPNNLKQPIKTAAQVIKLYSQHSRDIFSASWSHQLMTLGGLLGPKYESTGLSILLHNNLGDTKLSETLIPTLITGYHIAGESGIEFFSEDAKNFPEDKDCLLREIGLATTAAPIYFE